MRLASGLAAFSLLVVVAGCDPVWPGSPVGAYRVTATATSNGCGAAAIDGSTVTFDVELRRDGGFAYWRRNGLPLVSGGYGLDGAFSFHTSSEIATAGGVDGGAPTCVLVQDESIAGTSSATEDADGGVLDAGSLPDGGLPTVLSATDDVTFTTYAGSDCSVLLASRGGAFQAFPCTVHFELTGVPVAPFQ